MRFNRLKKTSEKQLKPLLVQNIFGSQISQSLTFKLPYSRVSLNNKLVKQINDMKITAAHHCMLYLTAPQVQKLHRFFIINKNYNSEDETHQSYNNPIDYQTYINPIIVETMGEKIQIEQSCLSIPFIKFIVPRYNEIKLEFQDESRNYITQKFTGKLSHIIQHCINHLDGQLLFEYKLSQGKFYVNKDLIQHFPKTSFLLKELSLRLKYHHIKIEKKQQISEEQNKKFIKMKQDYMSRLKKQYEIQRKAFSQKLDQKKLKII